MSLADVVIVLVVAAVITLAVLKIRKDKKAGRACVRLQRLFCRIRNLLMRK